MSTVDDVALLASGRDDLPPAGPANDTLIAEQRLASDPRTVAQARAFALRAVGDIPSSARSALELLVSELATNCFVHAGGEFTVRVFREPGRLRFECSDAGAGIVQMHDAEPNDTHGRGIFVMRQLADDWGVRSNAPEPGKTVCVSISLRDVPANIARLSQLSGIDQVLPSD